MHLGVSMRSFRAEHVSLLVKQMLDLDESGAKDTLTKIEKYPIIITRDLKKAKQWLKNSGILPQSRPENLTLNNWVKLANSFNKV